MPSGSTWTGFPATARTTSGWLTGGTARSSSPRTTTEAWPSPTPPRPSLTWYFTGIAPAVVPAVTVRAPEVSTPTPSASAATLSGSFSPSRQSATTPTVTWPPLTTAYFAADSVAVPFRIAGGVLTESSTTATLTVAVERLVAPPVPLLTV